MNKKNRTEEKPYLSDPVISRNGKIGRVNVDPVQKKETAKKPEKARKAESSVPVPARVNDISISDGEFTRNKAVKKRKSGGMHTVRSDLKRPFPVVTVIACVICTVLFMSLVFNLVRINEFTKDVAGMREEVTALEKRKDELSAQLDEKNSAEGLKKYIEERADSLGMVEEGKMNPAVAVTPERTEKIEEFDEEEVSDAVITTVLNALSKNFRDVLSALTGEE